MFTFMPWSKRTHTGGRLNLKTKSRCKRVTRHPLAPTSSFEVEPTAGVSTLALRHGSRCRLAWSSIDMVSTMYVLEAKLDSPLLAPLHYLHSVDEQHLHYVKRYHCT
ncbi:hypothetical protein ES332_A10G292100v1 [Gossypium tomentosum]|uniref:Uncharacterized protein n=1 Tax=Gossypium tomentosum TaxID=34277 RepID=A0A5D2NW72_GOSTO|nr:hypothetical protein ES332_A10G292100v1 [Gossypium tomentosum]